MDLLLGDGVGQVGPELCDVGIEKTLRSFLDAIGIPLFKLEYPIVDVYIFGDLLLFLLKQCVFVLSMSIIECEVADVIDEVTVVGSHKQVVFISPVDA